MIIFYEKGTGRIVGTIDGRIHSESHLKMWVGDKEKVARIVIQWKPSVWHDKDGFIIPNDCLTACYEDGSPVATNADFEADHPQTSLCKKLEKGSLSVYAYKIDLKTKKIVKK